MTVFRPSYRNMDSDGSRRGDYRMFGVLSRAGEHQGYNTDTVIDSRNYDRDYRRSFRSEVGCRLK